MVNKELDVLACKKFVCPNLSIIDQKGKELGLKNTTIEKAKSMAIEYFKKTYHKPSYSSARRLMPSFVYMASIIEGEKRHQTGIAGVFGTTAVTIKRWNRDITATLGINIDYRDRYRDSDAVPVPREFVCPDLGPIDKIGKALGLMDSTIEKAKELCVRYIKATCKENRRRSVDYIFSSSIYVASVIKNDKRSQIDIYGISNVSECNISIYGRDIIKTLGIKIIYGFNDRIISVSEEPQ